MKMNSSKLNSLKKITICFVLLAAMLTPAFAFAGDEPDFSFTAVSDIHIDDLLFQTIEPNIVQYAKILKDSEGHRDLFICNGDISSYGNQLIWYLAKDWAEDTCFDNYIWILGNHEYGTTGLRSFTKAKFKKFAQRDSLYFHDVIEGYHFICLGVEEAIPLFPWSYSDAQVSWFKEELSKAAAESEGKPIFVIGHFGPITGKIDESICPIIEEEAGKGAKIVYLWGHEHGFEFNRYKLSDLITEENGYLSARVGTDHYYLSQNTDVLYVDVFDGDKVVLNLERVCGKKLNPDTYEFSLK